MRTTTGIRLPAALQRAAERQAKREHRSLSGLIDFTQDQWILPAFPSEFPQNRLRP
jgi:hypothetical protein